MTVVVTYKIKGLHFAIFQFKEYEIGKFLNWKLALLQIITELEYDLTESYTVYSFIRFK